MRASPALIVLALLAAVPAAGGDHPLAGDQLRLRDAGPDRQTVRFRGFFDGAIDAAPDPRVTGATLEVVGRATGDGSSLVALPGAGWAALGDPPRFKGYRFHSRKQSILLKAAGGTARLLVRGGGEQWSYGLGSPQTGPIDVRLTIGDAVYCARFTSFLEDDGRDVVAMESAPPAHCALCGDAIIEATTEECDDGNAENGDGCSAACQLEDQSALCAGVSVASGTGLAKVLVASGLTRPIDVTAPPLDPNRLFIVEKGGLIRVLDHGVLRATPFLDLTGQVSTGIEQGLFSMAFDPDYEVNGFFYVSYTEFASPFTGVCSVSFSGAGDNVIARYQVSADPNLADPDSRTVVLTVDQPDIGHNGGFITFGPPPDGFLYFGVGDGANPGDPCEAAQNDLSPLGKLLRIGVQAPLPIDPVASIWAKGFRNPWRFSFDRSTGDLYVGDVGQDSWEEVSYQAAGTIGGANFQWDELEARHCFEPATGCDTSGTAPVLEVPHDPACAVTGGYVYRGCALPDLRGTYFYSDFCDSQIRSFRGVSGGDAQDLIEHSDLAPGLGAVVSFGEDARGELYIVDFGDKPGSAGLGAVYRIVHGN